MYLPLNLIHNTSHIALCCPVCLAVEAESLFLSGICHSVSKTQKSVAKTMAVSAVHGGLLKYILVYLY